MALRERQHPNIVSHPDDNGCWDVVEKKRSPKTRLTSLTSNEKNKENVPVTTGNVSYHPPLNNNESNTLLKKASKRQVIQSCGPTAPPKLVGSLRDKISLSRVPPGWSSRAKNAVPKVEAIRPAPFRMEILSARPKPSETRIVARTVQDLSRQFVDAARLGCESSSSLSTPSIALTEIDSREIDTREIVSPQMASSLRSESLVLTRQIRDIINVTINTETAAEAETALRTAIKRFHSGQSKIRPDGACFNTVIHAYGELGNAPAAEAVLLLMFQDYEQGNLLAEPNVRVYTNVLHAWRKSRSLDAPERCELILQSMHRLSESGTLPNCQPDAFSYTVLFHCWAESNRADAAENAERLFRSMKKRYSQGNHGLQPDAIAYSNLLNIFTQRPALHSRAEDLLWEMVDDYLHGNCRAEPRIRNFNTILAMWSKSSEYEAPERAQALVMKLKDLSLAQALPVQPDSYTYSLLLKTWAAANRSDGVSRAVKCLQWMEDLYSSGEKAARPDVIKYTTCICALARKGLPDQAEILLNKMRTDFLNGNDDARPDSKTYDIVISAWTGVCPDRVDGARAEYLLQQMWTLHNTDLFKEIRPTSRMYKRTIIALKHRPERAEHLLFEMHHYHQAGKLSEGPDIQLYQTLIQAWEESNHPDRKKRARHLQAKMQHRLLPRSDKL